MDKKKKIGKVMGEFKDKKLKTSAGKKVTDKKQAFAIAASEAGLNENSFERTDDYNEFSMFVFGALIDDFGMIDEEAAHWTKEYDELINDYYLEGNSPEDAAAMIVKINPGNEDIDETIQNVVFNESITRARFVNAK